MGRFFCPNNMSDLRRIIAMDAMGADKGIREVVDGVALALQRAPSLEGVVLVGNEDEINPVLAEAGLQHNPKVSVFHASQVITMDEKPIQSLKTKKDASMIRTVELVKLGQCGAAVSCGNTGALMACSTLKLRPIEGVAKPALASVWPSKDSYFVVLDVGANPQCRPENLVQYALLGSEYARIVLGLEQPRIGLLSIGTEEGKGTPLTSETHDILKQMSDQINYVGLIEGFQIFRNEVDVVVTDGFTGNVMLKSCESLWSMMKVMIKEEATRNPVRMMMGLAFKGIFKSIRKRLDPDRFAGAPLLGLKGIVLKAHGSSSKEYIANAICIALTLVEKDLLSHIKDDIKKANVRIEAALKDAEREQACP
jgi:phosphate acyltransferase